MATCEMELASFRPSKGALSAVRKKVVDVPSRLSHAAREMLLAASDFACEPTDQPRWAEEVAARTQSFANTAFLVDGGSVEVRVRCQSSTLRGVVPHGWILS